MPAGQELLSTLRINRIMNALQDAREVPAPLKFLRRTPVVPATEGEVIARYVNRIQIADLVADDQQAVVYTTGKMTFETTPVPNLKHGVNVNQEQINQLNSILANPGLAGDAMVRSMLTTKAENLLTGIEQRMEALIIGMMLDGYNYDRLGIKMTGVTWGMPSDLKVTPAVPWTDPVNGDAVSDLLAMLLTGRIRYGIEYDRATMSTQAFRYAIAQAKFQSQVKTFLRGDIGFSNLNLANLKQQQGFLESVTGLVIELYDSRYWTQQPDGASVSAPFLPINKVVLSSSRHDNDPSVMDFANVPVAEAAVAPFVNNGTMGFPSGDLMGGVRGPVGYSDAQLNPPSLRLWGVARGFPRKFMLQATAALTVGQFADTIPIGEPFN